jgi:hypothetical protein
LTYFDPSRHAASVRGACLLVGGDSDWLGPLREALGEQAQEYLLTHRGAIDQDWLDAWLATRLGCPPRSRFREVL